MVFWDEVRRSHYVLYYGFTPILGWGRPYMETNGVQTSNTGNGKLVGTSSKKLLGTSASPLVTSALLLVVTRS